LGKHSLNRFDFMHSERSGGSRIRWRQIALFAALFFSAFVVTVAIVSYPGTPQPRFASQSHAIRHANHRARLETHIAHSKPHQLRIIVHHRFVPSAAPQSRILAVQRLPREAPQHLLAVAVGGHPQAIISVGGQTRSVTIGDAVAGRIVESIDMGGIRLSGMSTELRIGR